MYWTVRQNGMSQTRHSPAAETARRSVPDRILGVGFRRETYANLAYLLARFPLGIAYFTVLVTGLALGTGLVPVVVGIPVLAGVIALGGYIGVIEAALLGHLCGREVAISPADPSELPVLDYLKAVVTTPRNYLLVAFGLASFPVGISAFVGITVVFTLGVVLAVAPLTYWLPGVEYDLTGVETTIELGSLSVDAGTISINTLPEALAVSPVGIGICLVGLHAVNLSAQALAGLTERMLTATSGSASA